MDYEKAYFSLFNTMTDVIQTLQEAQLLMEETYISEEKPAESPKSE